MKKVILLLLLGMCFTQCINAQLKKGNVLAGGSVSFNSEKYSEAEDNVGNFNFAPAFSYLFTDRFAAGLKINFDNLSDEGDSFRQFLFGPVLRYYLLDPSQKTNLFLEGCFAFGSDKYEGQEGISKTFFAFAAGPAFFINQFIAIDLALHWGSLKYKDATGRYNSIGLNAGFQIFLNCSKGKTAQ